MKLQVLLKLPVLGKVALRDRLVEVEFDTPEEVAAYIKGLRMGATHSNLLKSAAAIIVRLEEEEWVRGVQLVSK